MSETQTGALHVLLVDDDPDHVLIITRAIKEAAGDTDVQAVADGESALALLRASEALPDLILLDINMPGLSGLQVLAQVKTDAGLRRIPVIMLTSSELQEDVTRAYEPGASGYITKPGYLHDLRAVLGNTLLYWSAMKRAVSS